MVNNGRSSNRGAMGKNGNSANSGAVMSKTAEKFKAACPPQKWRDLEQLVKQHNGDETAIQARIMEWWEEGESVLGQPKAEERWENVNKKKSKNKFTNNTSGNAGGGNSSDRGTGGRDRGGGGGGQGGGRGGRGPGGANRGRGGSTFSGRGSKGGAASKKLGHTDTKTRKQGNAGGPASTSSSTHSAQTGAASSSNKDNGTSTALEGTSQVEQGFVASNDPTPSGSTTVPAFATAAKRGGAGNVWATKGTAHIIEAEKPKPPPPKPTITAPSKPAITSTATTTATSQARDLSLEKESHDNNAASSSAPDSPKLVPPFDGTLEEGITALRLDPDATNNATEEEALSAIPPTTDQTETETLLSEASSIAAGLSNGSNVNPPSAWKSVLAQNGVDVGGESSVLDLAPPAEESKTILKDELSVEDDDDDDEAKDEIEQEEEEEEEEEPESPAAVPNSSMDAVLPPQEIVTSPAVVSPTNGKTESSGQMNVLNMGRWDVTDNDDEQAIDFGFGSFGVETEDIPTDDADDDDDEEPEPEETEAQVVPSSNGLPAVVTDKVTAAKEASAAASTLSPSRPPPGLGLGSGAMPPMPAGAVLVHELEGKLEAAVNKSREEISTGSEKVVLRETTTTTTVPPVEEIKAPAAPQAPVVVNTTSDAPPAASVSVPSSSVPVATSGAAGLGGATPIVSAPQGQQGGGAGATAGMYPNAAAGGYGGAAPGMANMYSTYSGIGGFMGAGGVGVGMPTLLNPQHQAQQAAAQQLGGQPSGLSKGPPALGGPSSDAGNNLGKDDATENTTSTTAASTAGNNQANNNNNNPSSGGASSASALNSAFPPGIMAYNPAAAAAFGGGFYAQHAGYPHHGHQMAGNQGLNGNVNLPYGYGGYPPAQFGAGAGGYASAYQQQLAAQMGVGGGVGGPPGSNQSGSLGFGGGSGYGDSSGGNQSGSGLGDQHLGVGGGVGSGNDSRGMGSSGGYGSNKPNYRSTRNNNSGYNQGVGGGYGSHTQQSQYNQHSSTGLHQQHGGLGAYGSGNPYSAGIGGFGNQGMEHFQPQRGYGGVNLHSHSAYGMQQQSAYGNQGLGGGQGGFGQGQDASMDPFDSRSGHKGKGPKGPRAGGFGNSSSMQHQFQPVGVGGGQSFGALQPQGPDHGSGGTSSGGGGNSSSGGWGQQGWGGGAGAGSVNSWQQGSGN